jgi:MerR family transcriptional regulator, copper efflux regulator
MQIGEMAKKAGVSVQTVRFYERRGLLPEPGRKESGYRVYGDGDLKRLLFIRQAKALGFSLDEIRTILRMRERGQCPCATVLRLAEQHLEAIEQQLGQLSTFRDELRHAIRKWKQSRQQRLSADAFCVLIENVMSNGSSRRNTKSKRTVWVAPPRA